MRILVVLLVALSACSPFRGAPDRGGSASTDLAAVEASTDAPKVVACLAEPTVPCRNAIVAGRVYAMDLRFAAFEAELFRQTREGSFAATLATLGLNTAGALTGAGTTQVLSAIAGGLTGSKAAFEKEVLAERTLLAIHTAMRTNRRLVLARIRTGLREDLGGYPLTAGLSDTEDYYSAGTLLGGLIGVTEAVGVQAADASARLAVASGLSQAVDARALRGFLDAAGLAAPERRRRFLAIEAAMKDEGVDAASVASFVRDERPAVAGQQTRVARRLGLVP